MATTSVTDGFSRLQPIVRLQLAAMLQAPDAVRFAIAFNDESVAAAAPFRESLLHISLNARAQFVGLLLAPLPIRTSMVERLYASMSAPSDNPSPPDTIPTRMDGTMHTEAPFSRNATLRFVVQGAFMGAALPVPSDEQAQETDDVMTEFVQAALEAAVPRLKLALEAEWSQYIGTSRGAENDEPQSQNPNTSESPAVSHLRIIAARGCGDQNDDNAMQLHFEAVVEGIETEEHVRRALLGFCGHLLTQIRQGSGCCVQVETVRNHTFTLLFAPDPAGCIINQ